MDSETSVETNVQIRYKGQFITKKQLGKIRSTSDIGKNNKGRKVVVEEEKNIPSATREGNTGGYRVVSLSHLGKTMKCTSCEEYLSFENIEKETKFGLASELSIRCTKCLLLNRISTAEKCKSGSGYSVYEPNVRAVLGALHTEQGHTQMSNFLSVLNIPSMSQGTSKRQERNLIPAIEEVTRQSMEASVQKERRLTLENIEQLIMFL